MNERTKPSMNHVVNSAALLQDFADRQHIREDVNLNQIFQSVMKKHIPEEKRTLSIVRSDKLPFVCGKEEHLTRMFDALIVMIISHPPAASKLFLYIKCEIQTKDPEIIDLRLVQDYQMYTLYFHTNITTDAQWKLIHKDKLSECAVLAERNKGCFSFYSIANTGCIFSLSLPGKIN